MHRLIITLLSAIATCTAAADDWPQWRGPRRDAVSRETGLLADWPDSGPAIAWRASGIGAGYASIVIEGGRVYTIGQRDGDLFATALDEADGAIVWSRKIGQTTRDPCSTPTIDGDRLFVLDPDGELLCLDLVTGDTLWQRSFVDDFGGRMMSGRGYGESPLVDGDRVTCTPGGPEAAMVALDKLTGEVVWKATIPDVGPAGRDGMGFSSIVVAEVAGVRQYVQLMGRGLVGIDARDGRWLWAYNGICNDTANIPTPVVRGDLVFAANGYNAGSVLLQIAPQPGDDPATAIWQAQVVYRLKGSEFQNHHGGVALIGEDLYGGHGSNNGLPTRLDLATGRIAWKQRGPGVGSAAVIAADERLYFRYQNGLVALIEPLSQTFTVRGVLQIPGAGGDSWAHPAIANGRLYLREQDVLWAYDIRRDAAASPAAALTDRSPLSAELQALQTIGAHVEASTDKSPDFCRYAIDDAAHNGREPLWIVRLDNRLITVDGQLDPELLAALQAVAAPCLLDLGGTRIAIPGLTQLASVPQLVGLDLEFCPLIDDAAVVGLLPLSGLRVLVLAGTSISGDGLRGLSQLPALAALDLEVCDAVTDAACEALGAVPTLRALSLKKTGFERDRIADSGLLHLARLQHLEQLNLYGNGVTDAGLLHLQALTRLESLNLSLLPITDAGLAHLAPLRALRRLDLLYSVGFSGPFLTDAAAATLLNFSQLEALDLTGAGLTDTGLERLHELTSLKSIRLVRTKVTSDGAAKFTAALPTCEVIRTP